MCPVCITTVALITSGATSAGGLAALVAKQFRTKNVADKIPTQIQSKENHHGHEQDGITAPKSRIAGRVA